jgi:hypothetical protein
LSSRASELQQEIERLRADIEILTVQLDNVTEEYEQYLSHEISLSIHLDRWGEDYLFSSFYDFDETPTYTMKQDQVMTYHDLCDFFGNLLYNIESDQLNYLNIIVNQNDTNRVLSLHMSSTTAARLAYEHDPVFLKILNSKSAGDWYTMFAFTSRRPLSVQNPQTIRVDANASYVDKRKSEHNSTGQSLAYIQSSYQYSEFSRFNKIRLLMQPRHYYEIQLELRPATTPSAAMPVQTNWWW